MTHACCNAATRLSEKESNRVENLQGEDALEAQKGIFEIATCNIVVCCEFPACQRGYLGLKVLRLGTPPP